MARRKNEDDLPLIGIDPHKTGKSVIQKSAPLLSLWQSPLSLSEFKILDAYLARIDSHHPERRWVRFSKGDLEELLGLQKINIADLKKHIEHLGIMVKVEDLDDVEGFHSVALFEEAVCRRDIDGLWQVDLKCTPGAMKYIFNIDDIGYLRYKLRSVIHINSRYSYLMFLYLERNRFLGEWTVSIDDLRNFLGCDDPTYREFKYFNRTILKRCKRELEEKTSCRFSYDFVKRGRNVCAIHFSMDPNSPDISEADLPETFEILPQTSEKQQMPSAEEQSDFSVSLRDLVLDACTPKNSDYPEFTEEEQRQIMAVLPMIPLSRMPLIDMLGPINDDLRFRWYHYLAEKYANLNRIASQGHIKNRFAYFMKMLKADIF